MSVLPRYPIYIPSKGRSATPYTANRLMADGVPFRMVVEPQEFDAYAAQVGKDRLLVLPWNNPPGTKDGLIKARNWIKEHSTAAGDERHWQLDDNMSMFFRSYKNRRLHCDAGVALRVTEDFVDRYANVAIAGLNYEMFHVGSTRRAPFFRNVHVYSCTLILNAIPHCWRLAYNDDTDMCLQVLADGWCTLLMNAFLVRKMQTMKVKGGNTTIYQADGRLHMARALQRIWPGVVGTSRKFERPQHVVKYAWTHFDTPLKLKPGIDLAKIPPNDYGIKLVEVGRVKSRTLRKVFEQAQIHSRK